MNFMSRKGGGTVALIEARHMPGVKTEDNLDVIRYDGYFFQSNPTSRRFGRTGDVDWFMCNSGVSPSEMDGLRHSLAAAIAIRGRKTRARKLCIGRNTSD